MCLNVYTVKHRITYVMMLLCMLISMAMTPGEAKISIYTCLVSSRTFIREVLVIWQLLTHLNKIISIRKGG